MARGSGSTVRWTTGITAAAVIAASLPALSGEGLGWSVADEMAAPTAAPVPQGQGGGGRRGGRGGVSATLFTLADANKDGSLSRPELKATLEQWATTWDRTNTGSLTAEQVRAGALTVFPPAAQTQTPIPAQVDAMIAALPERAPAKPKQPRRVLALARATGFVHGTIPLAARTVEELGRKTGAWSTVISYDASDINAANLRQFDAIFLASTTGHFVDDAVSPAATAARRQALVEFVRGGKGLAGVHAASDSYHTGTETAEAQAAQAMEVARALLARDTNRDGRLSRAEVSAAADAWFDTVDPTKTGLAAQADFGPRFAALLAETPAARGGRGQGPSNAGTWPEWNRMIGGSFLAHPWQHVWVKVDDPASPITAPFKGETFEITDETYTFTRESFSRDNVRVLLSIDVSRMTPDDVKRENRPWDHDYALSWIRADGKGRVFYAAHGHEARIYAMRPMLEHYLAGIQYALGDLQADDRPRPGGK
jgi:type 1 glutamine amidotransferase